MVSEIYLRSLGGLKMTDFWQGYSRLQTFSFFRACTMFFSVLTHFRLGTVFSVALLLGNTANAQLQPSFDLEISELENAIEALQGYRAGSLHNDLHRMKAGQLPDSIDLSPDETVLCEQLDKESRLIDKFIKLSKPHGYQTLYRGLQLNSFAPQIPLEPGAIYEPAGHLSTSFSRQSAEFFTYAHIDSNYREGQRYMMVIENADEMPGVQITDLGWKDASYADQKEVLTGTKNRFKVKGSRMIEINGKSVIEVNLEYLPTKCDTQPCVSGGVKSSLDRLRNLSP